MMKEANRTALLVSFSVFGLDALEEITELTRIFILFFTKKL